MPVFVGGGYLIYKSFCQGGNEFRPVFYEELDLLGVEKFFSYECGPAPLLWAKGNKYFYNYGELFRLRLNNNEIEIKFNKQVEKPRHLACIDIENLVNLNKFHLNEIIAEAQNFLRACYDEYSSDRKFVVSYSGGKDSEVVLDLMRSTFDDEKFVIVFCNTYNENKFTYEVVHEKKNLLKNFFIVTPLEPPQEVWRRRKPPTFFNRWCCAQMKEQPLYTFFTDKNEGYEIALISGVRRDESVRRAKYNRVGFHKRYKKVLCICPIFTWSSLDVWLYVFSKNLTINKAYRYGYSRIGCRVCPYSSKWSDFLDKTLFDENVFRKILREFAVVEGVSDIEKFVYEDWKNYNWYKKNK